MAFVCVRDRLPRGVNGIIIHVTDCLARRHPITGSILSLEGFVLLWTFICVLIWNIFWWDDIKEHKYRKQYLAIPSKQNNATLLQRPGLCETPSQFTQCSICTWLCNIVLGSEWRFHSCFALLPPPPPSWSARRQSARRQKQRSLNRQSVGCGTTPRRQSGDFAGFLILSVWG